MKEVELTRGYVAVVDDEDFERIAASKWSVLLTPTSGYAVRNAPTVDGVRGMIWMHHEIMGSPTAERLDHVNGNGLDNRRCNLRQASKAENGRNRRINANNTSGFKGVVRHGAKWKAQTSDADGRVYLGLHETKIAAARAYDDFARSRFGSFAALNFPSEGERAARVR